MQGRCFQLLKGAAGTGRRSVADLNRQGGQGAQSRDDGASDFLQEETKEAEGLARGAFA
jgi:hypothetical protein